VAKLSAAVAEPMRVATQTIRMTASIGIAPAQDALPIGELLHHADLAMYQAKVRGLSHAAWTAGAAVDSIDPDPCRHRPLPHDPPRETLSPRQAGAEAGIAREPDVPGQCPPHHRRFVELTLSSGAEQTRAGSCAPTCGPQQRNPTDVAPAGTYHRGDPVWVHREGAWRPGVVESASATAVRATYRWEGMGTAVDTMTACHVVVRAVADPQLDGRPSDQGIAA
jgi:hypothetical protein